MQAQSDSQLKSKANSRSSSQRQSRRILGPEGEAVALNIVEVDIDAIFSSSNESAAPKNARARSKTTDPTPTASIDKKPVLRRKPKNPFIEDEADQVTSASRTATESSGSSGSSIKNYKRMRDFIDPRIHIKNADVRHYWYKNNPSAETSEENTEDIQSLFKEKSKVIPRPKTERVENVRRRIDLLLIHVNKQRKDSLLSNIDGMNYRTYIEKKLKGANLLQLKAFEKLLNSVINGEIRTFEQLINRTEVIIGRPSREPRPKGHRIYKLNKMTPLDTENL